MVSLLVGYIIKNSKQELEAYIDCVLQLKFKFVMLQYL